jgi:2-polyprenyl-3-methyl-5-hydroxy-6-metoxy-1,4-benzoquinol methylase
LIVWVPARRLDAEWMDRPGLAADEIEGALRDIRWVNRLLGGRHALLGPLDRLFAATPPDRPVDLLDVGTGGGDLPLAMVRHGLRRGRRVRVTAVDSDPCAVRVAARHAAGCRQVRVLRADAERLPFREGAFDGVTASMFLHHFDHAGVVRLLRDFARLARRVVVVNDLRRHAVPWLFIAAVSRLTWRHRVFRHDSPLSVLRGFTEEELLRAAREADAGRASVDRRWPFRLVLTVAPDPDYS